MLIITILHFMMFDFLLLFVLIPLFYISVISYHKKNSSSFPSRLCHLYDTLTLNSNESNINP